MEDIQPKSELVSAPRIQGDAVITSIQGDIDLHNSPEVRAALLAILANSEPRRLIINLANVPYMDSSAIAVLVEALQKLRKVGGKVLLTDLQPRVRGLLEIARLDSIFILAKDEADAMAK